MKRKLNNGNEACKMIVEGFFVMFYSSPHHHTLHRKTLFSLASLFERLPQFTNFFSGSTCDTVSMDRHEKGQHTGGSVPFFPQNRHVGVSPKQKRINENVGSKIMWFTTGPVGDCIFLFSCCLPDTAITNVFPVYMPEACIPFKFHFFFR